MSPTTNGPSWACNPPASIIPLAAHRVANLFLKLIPWFVSLFAGAREQVCAQVVEQCHTHEQNDGDEPGLLAQHIGAFREWATADPLRGLENDLPAIEDGNGQQVEEPQRQRQQ